MSDEVESRLSRIETLTTRVRAAVRGPGADATRAQEQMFERYRVAVYRYLLGALRDATAADEVFSRLWEKVLTGGLQGFDPERGRFRNYLRTVLMRMARDYQTEQSKVAQLDVAEREDESAGAGRAFDASWLQGLIDLAREALEEANPTWFAILQLREQEPELSAEELARRASESLGVAMKASNWTQYLHRARERFADLLLQEVIRSLGNASRDEVLEELQSIGWATVLREAMQRRGLCG